MLKHKTFASSPISLARWVNSHSDQVRPVGVVVLDEKLTLFYEVQDEAQDLAETHSEAIRPHLQRFIYIKPKKRSELRYPESLRKRKACPISRIVSSVRGLECFKDMKTGEIKEVIRERAKTLGYFVVPKAQAKGYFGCNVELIADISEDPDYEDDE